MSFGGGSKAPSTPPRTANIDTQRTSSNQQGRILPIYWGRRRMAGQFISRVFNIKTVTRKSRGGKGSPSTITGVDYWASWAMAFCAGPIDGIREIWMDDQRVWSGNLTSSNGAALYVDITVEGRGQARLYFGYDNQVADPHLNDTTLPKPSNQDHPAYRGVCYMVFKGFYVGRSRTNLPNVELLLEKYPQEYDWISSGEAKVGPSGAEDCNPIAIIYDLIVNTRHGLGISRTRTNETELDDGLDTLNDEDLGISPLITSATTARQLIQQVLEYIDGYIYVGEDGRFSVRLIRENAPAALGTLTEEDFADPLRMPVEDWSQARSTTRVTFTNRDRNFDDDSASWRDPGAFKITSEASVQTVSRPWVTRQSVARHIAGATGAAAALPLSALSLPLKKAALPGNAIGQRYSLSYAPLGISNLIVRVTDQTLGGMDSLKVDAKARPERAWLNQAIYGDTDNPGGGSDDLVADAAAHQRVIELPYDLCIANKEGGPLPSIAALLARSDEYTTGYKVFRKVNANSEAYVNVGQDNAFAVRGTLAAAYSAATPRLDTLTGMLVNVTSFDNDFETLEIERALADTFLIFVGNEIMSLHKATLLSGSQFLICAIRARHGTYQQAHSSGDEVWIVERSLITPIRHAGMRNGSTHRYKLQTIIEDNEYPLDSAPVSDLTFTHRPYRPPAPLNLRKTATAAAQAGVVRATTYAASTTLYFRWDFTDQQHDDFWQQWKRANAQAWDSTTDYVINDEVTQGDYVFFCAQDHTNIQPQVTAGWAAYWHIKQGVPVPGTILKVVRAYDDLFINSVTLARGVKTWKVTTTTLNSAPWFNGTLIDFKIRAYSSLYKLTSDNCSELLVIKV